jgi:hypothetical protein
MESLVRVGFYTAAILVALHLSPNLYAQSDAPVARVTSRIDNDANKDSHPLDPALRLARRGLERMDQEIIDYTATLVRRERIDGQLKEAEFSAIKIRNPRVDATGKQIPFSIYMRVEKPSTLEGREALYVQGQNGNKIVGHEGQGVLKHLVVDLDPDGTLAMRGNRYPIYEAGVRNLIVKLLEKGERDRKREECEVKFFKNAQINGRKCTVMQVIHPEKRDYFDFHKVQIFIDNEHQIPIRYASWSWPTEADGKPVLEEEYTYVDFTPNVGLTDADFSRSNKAYKFE